MVVESEDQPRPKRARNGERKRAMLQPARRPSSPKKMRLRGAAGEVSAGIHGWLTIPGAGGESTSDSVDLNRFDGSEE